MDDILYIAFLIYYTLIHVYVWDKYVNKVIGDYFRCKYPNLFRSEVFGWGLFLFLWFLPLFFIISSRDCNPTFITDLVLDLFR